MIEFKKSFLLLGASPNKGQYKFHGSSCLKTKGLSSVLPVPHQGLASWEMLPHFHKRKSRCCCYSALLSSQRCWSWKTLLDDVKKVLDNATKMLNLTKDVFMQEYFLKTPKPKPEQRAHNSTYRNPRGLSEEEFSMGYLRWRGNCQSTYKKTSRLCWMLWWWRIIYGN